MSWILESLHCFAVETGAIPCCAEGFFRLRVGQLATGVSQLYKTNFEAILRAHKPIRRPLHPKIDQSACLLR